ncbi:MAG: hypothetical protein C7B45_05510 [Sulfobacillus acidophilus]|uniref:Uncharacterized protein n=1 Tax=Sulfobacillus acidophilus TaxID=53633 RepID=A0A2T2WKM0_9FIRM|nr:MAG: hypothetical protein C7B45_05510 [Sulfobacillus acidophilus]
MRHHGFTVRYHPEFWLRPIRFRISPDTLPLSPIYLNESTCTVRDSDLHEVELLLNRAMASKVAKSFMGGCTLKTACRVIKLSCTGTTLKISDHIRRQTA